MSNVDCREWFVKFLQIMVKVSALEWSSRQLVWKVKVKLIIPFTVQRMLYHYWWIKVCVC